MKEKFKSLFGLKICKTVCFIYKWQTEQYLPASMSKKPMIYKCKVTQPRCPYSIYCLQHIYKQGGTSTSSVPSEVWWTTAPGLQSWPSADRSVHLSRGMQWRNRNSFWSIMDHVFASFSYKRYQIKEIFGMHNQGVVPFQWTPTWKMVTCPFNTRCITIHEPLTKHCIIHNREPLTILPIGI